MGAEAGGVSTRVAASDVSARSLPDRRVRSASTGPGSQLSAPPGIPAASSRASGRSAGCFASIRPTTSASRGGRPSSSGSSWTTRYSSSYPAPEPNGPRPVAAYATTAPSEKTSPADPTVRPEACSGGM